jgi:bifunctional enzyme CysN/CysC
VSPAMAPSETPTVPPAPPRTRAPARASEEARLKVTVVGHVDHGKSSLIGRLLHDTGALPDGKIEAIRAMCARRGMPFEWAFVMDAFQAERDQAITIDSSQIWFHTEKRGYVIIDAPGHKEFVKNMVTGAASADAALLVVDAGEGVCEQSCRHGYLLHLLGIGQVCVVVNKMDSVDYDAARFAEVERDIRTFLDGLEIEAAAVIPVSAREGDNIASPSSRMPWYDGPLVSEAMDGFTLPSAVFDAPLRFPVQDVYKFDARRIVVGRIESGRLAVGDTLLFSPSNKTARVNSIEAWNVSPAPQSAGAGQSIGITLNEQIFVERGEVASHLQRAPVETDVFRANLFWLGRTPLEAGARYTLKLNTAELPVTVQSVERVIDPTDLAALKGGAIERNGVGEVVLQSSRIIALDEYRALPHGGRFVLIDGYDIAGGGIVSMEGYPDQRDQITVRAFNVTDVDHGVTAALRRARNNHKGGVLWFTGLSGAGKSTIAVELERRLFADGRQTYLLDGDNLRGGLNANLGFSPEDRAENIRRVGEVAALFADAGFIVISAFISPYRADRARADDAVQQRGTGEFHEIYVEASLETCEGRDPKGLYRKARAGEIADFTGISAPYEPPVDPALTLHTDTESVEQCVENLLDYVERRFVRL